MLKRCLWSAGVLAVATVLLQPQTSEAQRRMGLFRGSRGNSGMSSGSYSNNGMGYGYGNYGTGYGYGQPYQGAWGAPVYGANGYGAPLNGNLPSVFGGPTQSYQSFYPPTGMVQSNPNEARVVVLVPDPNAQVFVDGRQTRQMGSEREFVTEMDPGTRGTYRIKARWTQNGQTREQTRTVPVQPGARQVVNFSQPQGPGVSPQGTTPEDDNLNRQ